MLPVKQVIFKPIKTCLNCGMQFDDEDHFCRACGAKKIEERFTPKRVLDEAGEHIFNLDNTFLRTFRDLFVRPEAVIGGFLAGLRKRYLNAFSYFAISITISGFQVFVMKRFYPDVLEQLTRINGDGFGRRLQESLYEYQPVVMFSTIPLLALMGWITFLTLKKHNYTEHFIIQLYTYSHLSMLAALAGTVVLIAGLNYIPFMLMTIPLYVIYNAYMFKRLYGLSWKGITLRTLLFIPIFLIIYFLISAIIVAILIAIDPQSFLEMAKQSRL